MSDTDNPEVQLPSDNDQQASTNASKRPEDRAYVAPRNVIEKIVANNYERLLQVERVGVYDDFFGLGGDSLLVLQLVYQLSQTFNIGLPQRSIMMAPTVMGVADTIVRCLSEQIGDEAVTEILSQIEELSQDEVENLLISGENEERG
jgi:acyl carrier protein